MSRYDDIAGLAVACVLVVAGVACLAVWLVGLWTAAGWLWELIAR